MSGINLRHVSYDEIVNDLKPGNDASGSSVLPEIARSGGDLRQRDEIAGLG